MNVVVPMAGRGSRLANTAGTTPKPLISVLGRPMVSWALKSIENVLYNQIIFVALKEHDEKFQVKKVLTLAMNRPFELLLLDGITEGQLCTVLEAKSHINTDEDLLIISSDTYVISEIGKHIAQRGSDCSGLISVASLPGNQWSFAQTDENGKVIRVAEKERISDFASTGLYYFSNGRIFVERAEEVISTGERTRNEFYVMPLYQKYIDRGEVIGISPAKHTFDMGSPEALSAAETFFKTL
jgi:UDP-N-acetylglucosamine diphosphorylase / glucose-1-phosphate thymidylyltransferase / UDP-N-acetylgalactosamine diphosphorylase / glucosamine-1-phosphate N-acetyltransferase / galactosamine-1-phosphate N-acetyltransferase